MNKVSIRVLALCVLGAFSAGAMPHGLIQDPPARNWFCGAITKPDHVANGTAQYPVCGNAFSAPGIPFEAGYSFMSVLTHTTGRSGVGAARQCLRIQFRDLERRGHRLGPAHRLADDSHDRRVAQLHLEHFLGSALLGHRGVPLLDHAVRASCGRRAGRCRSPTSRPRRSAR